VNFTNSTSSVLAQTVTKADTTTALGSSVNPSVFGQAVVFTATVSPVAPGAGTRTGTVTFMDGLTTLGSPAVNASGVAVLTNSSLSVSNHIITATYNSDANFNSSTSADLTQTVNMASSATTVSSSLNPSTFGSSVTFTAKVVAVSPGGGTPTGTVTFNIDCTPQSPVSLSGGLATFTTSSLSVTNHTITADFSGDGNFNTSSTPTNFTQTVSTAGS